MKKAVLLQILGEKTTHFFLMEEDITTDDGIYLKGNVLYININLNLDDETYPDYKDLLKNGGKYLAKDEALRLVSLNNKRELLWTEKDKELFVNTYSKLVNNYKQKGKRELDAYIALGVELIKNKSYADPKKVLETLVNLTERTN